jgi:hypothetical protein
LKLPDIPAAMRFDNRAADRQAQANSCLLCRKKWFEDVVDQFWRETAAAIAHTDQNLASFGCLCPDGKVSRGRRTQRGARATETKTFEALPVIVYSFFGVRYVAANRFPPLQVIALFSMRLPALVALIRIFMSENNNVAGSPNVNSKSAP